MYIWSGIYSRIFIGDKIYINHNFIEDVNTKKNSEMLALIKVVKGMEEVMKQRIPAADNLFSTAVSTIDYQ